MEYQTSSSVAVSQKLSTGHSIYDGVFTSAPSKFTLSSFSSRLEDYSEIFGSGAASSIPVLEVPELNERRVDARCSKLDYSNVFGGFGDSDFAVPYEELFAEPKKKTKLQKESRRQGERVLPPKEAKCSEENIDLRNEEAYESVDGVKKFSMSYNQINNRSKSFAGVHSVPAYTCLVDETSPLRGTDGDKSMSMSSVAKERRTEGSLSAKGMRDQAAGDAGKEAPGGGGVKGQNSSNRKNSIDELFNSNKTGQGADPLSIPPFSSQVSEGDKPVFKVANDASSVDGVERKMEGNHHQATDASKQTSREVAKVQNSSKWRSSGSIDKLFYSGELAQETRSSNMPPFSSMCSEGKGEIEKSVASMFQGLNCDTFEGADSVSSPAYFDEEVDTNSVAAASVAALTKAIEEAQASIQMAKELMDRKKVGPQYRVKQSFDNSAKPKSRKGGRFADKASISKEAKTQELYDKVDIPFRVSTGPEIAIPVFENASIMSDVMVTGNEVREKEIADNASIFSKKKTQELQEEVHVSAVPDKVTVALDSEVHVSGVMETLEKVHVQEFKPTSTEHMHEEADDSEAAEQFYEFPDTSEQDVSDTAEQFYEFADSSEPDVSEATEEFYEFADSNEHHNIILENQEANNTRQMFPSVDEYEQEKKKNMGALENLEQVGKTLEAATAEEQREVKNIFNVVGEVSEFEESENEFASSQEGSDQDDNEKLQEASREHEEAGKLTTTLTKEFCEEKQNGDVKRFETRELQETEHVQISLEDQEWVENEKIDTEACVLEEIEREQAYAQREEDTVRSLDGDNNAEIIETVNDCYDKKDFEKRLKNDSKSEGNKKLQDTKLNEKILEDDSTSEGNQKLQDTRPNEKILEDDSKSEGNENLQDTRLNEKIVEEATCQKECENHQEESFKFVEAGRMPTLKDERTENEQVQVTQEDQKNLECNFEAADNLYEQDVSEDLNGKRGSARHVDCNQDVEETPKLSTNKEDGGVKEVSETSIQPEENEHQTQLVEEENGMAEKEVVETSIQPEENEHQTQLVEEENGMAEKEVVETSIQLEENKHQTQLVEEEIDMAEKEVVETLTQLEENENRTELVEEENGMVKKETCETDGLTPGVKLPERLKQMEDATEIHSFDKNGISTSENDMSFVQKQDDQLAGEAESDFNVGRQGEECEESGNSDLIGAEVAVNQERNKNGSKSRKRWFGTNEVSETFIKLEEDGNQSESVEEEDVMEEKGICEVEGLASGVKLAEILKQMEDVIEIHSSDTNGTSVYGQKQDAHLGREPEGACNLRKHVEEVGDINKDVMGPEVAAVNQEESMNTARSSHRKRWFDNGNDTKVAQAPHIFARSVLLGNETDTRTDEDSQQATMRPKESEATLPAEESETSYTSQKEVEREKENQQESQTANEFDVSASSQKAVELEKEHLIQKAERRRERERLKEKRAVERAIREARERSFADVKERVAETRQKVMAEAQGRLGKTSVQANDTSSLAEKASKEAKQKWERAAVERAHTEARDRALEKALAEKAKRSVSDKFSGASPDGKPAKRSVTEKFSGASRDNGVNRSLDLESKGSSASSTSGSPNSSNQSDPSPAERSAGTNGESAQRCKARLERNQRTAERAAKALAEKNNRDLLVQQEQAERNRLAEVLDAEVKRWSSGKERNLRALLSTLQYILGPDSGWQPVHLTDIVTAVAVKKAYRKAALFVHPDKLQQRGASIQQKYTCEKVFDLLKDAWNRFSVEEQQR